MGVFLVLESLVQEMVNVAVFNAYIFRVDLDTVTLSVPDRAVAQHDIVREDTYQVLFAPLAIDKNVLVNSRFGDAKRLHPFRIGVGSNRTSEAGIFRCPGAPA